MTYDRAVRKGILLSVRVRFNKRQGNLKVGIPAKTKQTNHDRRNYKDVPVEEDKETFYI